MNYELVLQAVAPGHPRVTVAGTRRPQALLAFREAVIDDLLAKVARFENDGQAALAGLHIAELERVHRAFKLLTGADASAS